MLAPPQAEQELRRLRELNALKDTFLSAASHELRGPLTTIKGTAGLLCMRIDELSHDEIEDLAGRLLGNAERLERLIGELLDVERLTNGSWCPRREACDLSSLARLAVAQTSVWERRSIDLPEEEVTAQVDPMMVERIVENLVVNADKYSPPGEPLWVRTRRTASGALLEVEDAGPGIPKGDQERVFEPFERLGCHEGQHGSGLGLTLVARFAELHGGRAWVTDAAGGGASVKVLLPDA